MKLLRDGTVAAAVIMAVWPAHAANWAITPSAAVDETFTDNVGLRRDSEDRNSDLVTTLSPGITVRGTGRRITLNGDYTLNVLRHIHDTQQDTIRNFLNASGTAEVWEQSVFLDAGAQIAPQVANTQAPTSQSSANTGVNTLETTSWSVGPRFLHHFGTWAETTSAFSHRATTTSGSDGSADGATSGTVAGTAPIRSSAIDSSTFVLQSGRRFTQFLWSVSAHDIKSSSDQAPHHTDKVGRADVTYVVNRQISLNAGGGLQIITDDSLVDSPNGPIWTIGATYRPGRRVTLHVAYNSQFNSKFFTYSGTYIVSPRTQISFEHTETITTTTQQLAQRQPVFDPTTGLFIDPVTLQPVDPLAAPTGLQETTQNVKTWRANFSSKSGRNSYNLSLSRTESKFQPSGQTTTQNSAVVTYSRSLSRRMNGSLSANYNVSDTSGGPTAIAGATTATATNTSSTNILLNGTLSYTLTPETSANFTLRYSAFDAGSETLNTHEKSVSLSLRRTF